MILIKLMYRHFDLDKMTILYSNNNKCLRKLSCYKTNKKSKYKQINFLFFNRSFTNKQFKYCNYSDLSFNYNRMKHLRLMIHFFYY